MIPGNTDLSSYNKSTVSLTKLDVFDKKAIILATNDVNDISLFLNGLTQNIIILYDLFESLGYKSYLLQHTRNNSEKKEALIKLQTELYANIDTFKSIIAQYDETENTQLVNDAVELYINTMIPRLKEIMKKKYSYSGVDYDKNDNTFHLIQKPVTIKVSTGIVFKFKFKFKNLFSFCSI